MTPYGFKMFLGHAPAHHAMRRGTFEREEMEVLKRQLANADVFVDVGANIGLYTCAALVEGKVVIAIEPQVSNLRLLYATLLANGFTRLEVMPVGVSDKPGLLTLYGASGTGASLLKGWAQQSERFATTIPVSTLDIITSTRYEHKKLVIKVDVEGAEYSVLGGALNLLGMTPRPTWLIEISLNEFHPSGRNPHYQETFELFWNAGYQIHTADRVANEVRPQDVSDWVDRGKCESGSINYLCTPR
jgi:FkbM family methyltransferase